MARRGISREKVFEIAQSLADQGEQPTIAAIRRHIGSGSFSTISGYLDEWRTLQKQTGSSESVPEPPATVTAAFNRIWMEACAVSQEMMENERQALAAMREQLEKEHQEMRAEIARLEAALTQAQEETGKTATALAAAKERNQTLEVENTRLEERLHASQSEKIEQDRLIIQLQDDLSAVRAEAGRATQDLERAHEQKDKLQEQCTHLITERDEVKTRLASVCQELTHAREDHARDCAMFEKESARFQADLAREQESRCRAEEKIEELARSLETERRNLDEAKSSAGELREEVATLVAQHDASERRATELAVQVERLQDQLIKLSSKGKPKRRSKTEDS